MTDIFSKTDIAKYESIKRRLGDFRRNLNDLHSQHLNNPVYSGWAQFKDWQQSDEILPMIFGKYQDSLFTTASPFGGCHQIHFTKEPSSLAELRKQVQILDKFVDPLNALVDSIPESFKDRFRLPVFSSWWIKLHHLAWHFPSEQALDAKRMRLLRETILIDGKSRQEHRFYNTPVPERTTQLLFRAEDRFKGLIYSKFGSDAYMASVEAIDFITQVIDQQLIASSEEVDDSSKYFELLQHTCKNASAGMKRDHDVQYIFELVKCSDSFETPPAAEWAGFQEGGAPWRTIPLSELNEDFEFCFIRGSYTDWIAKLSREAGQHLPKSIPDVPLLFQRDSTQKNVHYIHVRHAPVMNRRPEARWLGFVFSTLFRMKPDLIRVHWKSVISEHHLYGFAVLTVDPFEAMALAIELAGLAAPVKSLTEKQQTIESQPDDKIQFLGNRQYLIGKHPPITLTDNEDNVLQAFLKQSSMDESQLIEQAGFDRAPRVLRELRDKYDKRFAPAIKTPGRKGSGGYQVKIVHAPKTPE